MIRTRNAICAFSLRRALYVVKNNLDSQKQRIMKIADLSTNYEFVGFLYEKASPFVEKFDRLMLRMVECAVFPDREIGKVKLHDVKDQLSDVDNTIIKITLTIMLVGLSSATITFFYEVSFFQ